MNVSNSHYITTTFVLNFCIYRLEDANISIVRYCKTFTKLLTIWCMVDVFYLFMRWEMWCVQFVLFDVIDYNPYQNLSKDLLSFITQDWMCDQWATDDRIYQNDCSNLPSIRVKCNASKWRRPHRSEKFNENKFCLYYCLCTFWVTSVHFTFTTKI